MMQKNTDISTLKIFQIEKTSYEYERCHFGHSCMNTYQSWKLKY